MVPVLRTRLLNDAPIRPDGSFVLYWMTSARRAGWNFALDRAVELARELGKPLVVLEALRAGYPWASDRIHRFVIEGMRANERAFARAGVSYHPYVEPEPAAGKGLLRALADDACAVVGDDYPCFFLPRMLARASQEVHVRFEAVDTNGLLPIRATDRVFARAVDFRRFLQRELGDHLGEFPKENPLARAALPRLRGLPRKITERWPRPSPVLWKAGAEALAALPIDHEVAPIAIEGGGDAGERAIRRFVDDGLDRYGDRRGDVGSDATSGLSPYLHFGHVSPHQVLARVASHEGWSAGIVGGGARGKKEGWWGMRAPAEAFLDELVTWRELGFHTCAKVKDYDRYASLPDWARRTLAKHEADPRPQVYTLARFEAARTHDELWNAAQNQLRGEGRIHGYLRMLWGKKILHWSRSPRAALATMIELNNKYAIDGRDPNSYSGIFWTLGRYDRPWGPERPIFGTVRYMTSESTRRKMRVDEYVRRWTADR